MHVKNIDTLANFYMPTLTAALQQFEATEANLGKLEKLWGQISELIPSGPAFGDPPDYDELCLAFQRILPALPSINGLRVEDRLFAYSEAGQMRLDALEVGEIDAQVSVDNALEEQGKLLREYRFHLNAKRRELVRNRLLALIDEIDGLLRTLAPRTGGTVGNELVGGPEWVRLKESIDEIATLLGSNPKPPRWTDLRRHLGFAMMGELLIFVSTIGQLLKPDCAPIFMVSMIRFRFKLMTLLILLPRAPQGALHRG